MKKLLIALAVAACSLSVKAQDIVDTAIAAGNFKTLVTAVKAGAVKTVQGSSLTVTTTDGVKVDNAKVIKTDIVTSNGVIHAIDTVVLPK